MVIQLTTQCRGALVCALLFGGIFLAAGTSNAAEPATAPADEVTAPKEKAKKAKKATPSYKFSGALTFSAATDRIAGSAPMTDGFQGDFASDEDEDEFEDSDMFKDLDLDDEDATDLIDESVDEDGDGDFFDEDGDGGEEEGDLDGDGIPDLEEVVGDDDGDGILDAVDTGAPAAARPRPSPRGDDRYAYGGKFGYTQKIGGAIKEWKTGAKIAATDNDEFSQKDSILFGLNTGPVFKVKALKAQFQPNFTFVSIRKDGVDILDAYGLGLKAEFKLSKQWQLGLKYGYDMREFADEKNLGNRKLADIDGHTFGAQIQYAFAKKHSVSFGYSNRFEDTDFVRARTKTQHQLKLGYQKKWSSGIYIKPQLGFAMNKRDAPAKPTQPRREDDRLTYGVALGVAWKHGLSTEFQYGATETEVDLEDKDSSNDRFVLVANFKL